MNRKFDELIIGDDVTLNGFRFVVDDGSFRDFFFGDLDEDVLEELDIITLLHQESGNKIYVTKEMYNKLKD